MTTLEQPTPNPASDQQGPEGEEDQPLTTSDALAQLHDTLHRLVEAEALSPSFAHIAGKFLTNSKSLADTEVHALAQALHLNTRSAITDDGAPPQDMPVLTAPDLRVEAEGTTTTPLPEAPDPDDESKLSALRGLLDNRRSVPYFANEPMALEDLSMLLETALGSRELLFAYNRKDVPSRRFPSAGGLQPVDTYVFVHQVDGVQQGVHRYNPVARELVLVDPGDPRVSLIECALQTDWLFHAPVVIGLVVDLKRVLWKYGTRGYRFAHVDTGIASMNVCLTAEAMGFYSNPVAAFDDDKCNELLGLDGSMKFLNLLLAVGKRPLRWR